MPEGDLKLAARTAVTMGWDITLAYIITQGQISVFVGDPSGEGFACKLFAPFTDASIPYGLIGQGVWGVYQFHSNAKFMANGDSPNSLESKTHAILNAYCAADPSGHWAKFLKGE